MENKLEIIRHSLSHLLSAAVLEIFPEAKLGMGPAIENGFYYDFDLPRTLIPEDLPILEEKMRALIKKNVEFQKYSEPVDEAVEFWKKAKQPYKVELTQELAKEKKEVSFYRSGDFVDLCEGPHVKSTKEISADAFGLDKIAGAYWRGLEKNKMLQRIYGVAFETEKELKDYLIRQEEAERRDHRKLGKELELFTISPQVGSGLAIMLPKGTVIWDELNRYRREEQWKRGYQGVSTPHIAKIDLYKTSGHWQHYREIMYPPIKVEGEEYILKPMNCPHHIMIYETKSRSYRDLPIRLAELGTVYRWEKSGEVGGLTRVRGITQDDAHIFCRPDQVQTEFEDVIDYVLKYLKILKFNSFRARLGIRDLKSDKYVGSDAQWKKAEANIAAAAKKIGLEYTTEEGEAAFYGPKLDFVVNDIIGREWQLGTVQVDYNLPERFKLKYAGEDGKSHRPVMIHRAPFGSMERFIGILIEHFAGAFPVWLAPTQVVIIPVSDKYNDYGREVYNKLVENSIRTELDDSNESVGKRIRNAEIKKIPYILAVGEKEAKDEKVSVRQRNKEVYTVKLDKFIKELSNIIRERG